MLFDKCVIWLLLNSKYFDLFLLIVSSSCYFIFYSENELRDFVVVSVEVGRMIYYNFIGYFGSFIFVLFILYVI